MRNFEPRSTADPLPRWIGGPLLSPSAAAGTDAHRVCSSGAAWLERFGDDLLLSYQEEAARAAVLAGLEEWEAASGWRHQRIFAKFIPLQNADRVAPEQLEGAAGLPLTTVVREAGLRYGLDFEAGYSAGLFIDQRANRALVARAGVKRLLNTFAYTCSFSVVAAKAGAETVSVDLSKKSLDRGRANFALNDLPLEPHRFIADDVLDVLPRLARRGEKFDAIVLDPPTFSRGNKGRRFQVEQNFEDLLVAALEVAAPGARLLLSTNCTRLGRRELERIARFVMKHQRRGGDFHAEPALPDFPPGAGAQTVWLTLR